MKTHHTLGLVMGATLAVASTSANALTLLYNDFSDTSGLTLNGATAGLNPNGDNHLRLTNSLSQSGSAFSSTAVPLDADVSFSTAFSFNISNPQGAFDSDGQGADGISFTVQTNSNTAGGAGGGIGYFGIGNSLSIEFDTWNNGAIDDNNGNHVGISLNGNVDAIVQTALTTRMNNGQDWFAWIDYNGATDDLEVRVAETNVRPGSTLLSYNVDLTSVLGTNLAYVGFTSGTGAAGGQHDILNWQFNSTFNPIGAPAPAAVLLLLTGLIGFRVSSKVRS